MRNNHILVALTAMLLVMLSCAPSTEKRTDHDHRMAMALLVAGYPVDDIDCIKKSYPEFFAQWKRITT